MLEISRLFYNTISFTTNTIPYYELYIIMEIVVFYWDYSLDAMVV
jgi:hypothetical protein